MAVEGAQSTKSKPVTTGVVANILRWFAEIRAAAKSVFRGGRPASAESRAERTAMEPATVATAPVIPVIAHATVDSDSVISRLARTELDEQEIVRRRDLVRRLFTDFWSGEDEKPASFTARVDQAEDYLNDRLAANGESWRLDTETRAMLGLPLRSNSPNNGKKRAARA